MNFLIVALKDLKIRLADRKGFITLLAMPLLLTAILGSALSGVFGENTSIPQTTVGVMTSDNGALSKQLIHEVFQGEQLKERMTVKKYSSEADLKKAVEKQQVDVGLIISENWSNDLLKGKADASTILVDAGKKLQASIVDSIVTSFVNRATSVSISTQTVTKELARNNPNMDINKVKNELASHLEKINEGNIPLVKTEKGGKPVLTGMQYYAAAMCAMFVLFNATIGAKSIMQERTTDTLARLMMSPIRHYSIVVGKFAGTLFFSFLQFLVFVLATRLLFHVSWGNDYLQTMIIGFAYAIAVSGLAMMIAGLIVEEKTADTVGGIGVQIFALLGGSMIPIGAFPDGLQKLANITPNKWVLNSLLDIMNGTTWEQLILPITVLMLIGFIALFIGSLKLKLK